MAKKSVLLEAINKLEKANIALLERIGKSKTKEKTAEYRQQITKNESMILDYKFRLEHE